MAVGSQSPMAVGVVGTNTGTNTSMDPRYYTLQQQLAAMSSPPSGVLLGPGDTARYDNWYALHNSLQDQLWQMQNGTAAAPATQTATTGTGVAGSGQAAAAAPAVGPALPDVPVAPTGPLWTADTTFNSMAPQGWDTLQSNLYDQQVAQVKAKLAAMGDLSSSNMNGALESAAASAQNQVLGMQSSENQQKNAYQLQLAGLQQQGTLNAYGMQQNQFSMGTQQAMDTWQMQEQSAQNQLQQQQMAQQNQQFYASLANSQQQQQQQWDMMKAQMENSDLWNLIGDLHQSYTVPEAPSSAGIGDTSSGGGFSGPYSTPQQPYQQQTAMPLAASQSPTGFGSPVDFGYDTSVWGQ